MTSTGVPLTTHALYRHFRIDSKANGASIGSPSITIGSATDPVLVMRARTFTWLSMPAFLTQPGANRKLPWAHDTEPRA